LKLQFLNITEQNVVELSTLFRFLALLCLFLFNDKRCILKDVYKLKIALDKVSWLKSLLNLLILLDVLHLRLHFLEYNSQLFGLQRNNFIIISDFFDVFNLLSLGLLFDADNLIFEISLLRELFDHLGDYLITIGG
jgi:hypothetical protein